MCNLYRLFGRVSVVVVLLVSLVTVGGAVPATAPATRPVLTMTVAPGGDIRVLLGEKLLASGHWVLYRDFRAGEPGQVALGDPTKYSARQDSPTHATVSDTYTNALATTDIKLEGEDLRLSVHVQNLDAKRPLKNMAFNGLTFHFSRDASGTLPALHYSYIAAEGAKIFHPGLGTPVGAVFAHDDAFGFAVHSRSEFDRQTLFYAQWQRDGIIPAECQVNFLTMQPVPPGQAVDIDANFRISTDMSIPHLLEDYKKVYTDHFPSLLYKADSRPVGQFAAVGSNLITATNPLGYGGGFRRLDSAAGTGAYIRIVAPLLHRADAVGLIFWSPGGFRQPMYPPDFDVFPKSVQENIPTLVEGFKKHGLRVGLCARCGDGVKRPNEKEFEMYRLNADDPEQMKTLLDRFDHAMQMGFDIFYLDSFGVDNPNDQKMLEKIRAKVGKDVLLYTEFCSDMSLPYAGHYCEWRANYILWTSDEQYAALKYLCPDSTWLAKSRVKAQVPPEYAKLGLTPLVEDAALGYLPASRPSQ